MVYLSFSPQVMKFEPVPRYTGGTTPLYKPYRYVPPHREGVLRRFGLKTDIHFAHFDLESGMVFEGATYESVWTYLPFQWKKEKYANLKRIRKIFLFAL